MICLIALVVFGVLGIFSVSHRKIALEAFDCVFRKITLRKCQTGLDQRLKSQVMGALLRKNPGVAKFVYKRFEIISWAFTILMIASIFFSLRGLYLFSVYGNCNGPQADAFCVFDPKGYNRQSYIGVNYTGEVVYPGVDDDEVRGSPDAAVTIIEFGCYKCPYTRQAEPVVRQILDRYGDRIRFVYRDAPLVESHQGADFNAEAAQCAGEQGRYWEYHDILFSEEYAQCAIPGHEMDLGAYLPTLSSHAGKLGLNVTDFEECLTERRYEDEVMGDANDAIRAGVQGTPTFFINNRTVVGPKPLRTFTKIIDSELKKHGVE